MLTPQDQTLRFSIGIVSAYPFQPLHWCYSAMSFEILHFEELAQLFCWKYDTNNWNETSVRWYLQMKLTYLLGAGDVNSNESALIRVSSSKSCNDGSGTASWMIITGVGVTGMIGLRTFITSWKNEHRTNWHLEFIFIVITRCMPINESEASHCVGMRRQEIPILSTI